MTVFILFLYGHLFPFILPEFVVLTQRCFLLGANAPEHSITSENVREGSRGYEAVEN